MKNWVYDGAPVVCTQDASNYGDPWFFLGESVPDVGTIYTIRRVFVPNDKCPGCKNSMLLWLNEIVNPERQERMETAFCICIFRPPTQDEIKLTTKVREDA